MSRIILDTERLRLREITADDYAFERLGRRRIISMIRPENAPSRRVAKRNGLQIERQIFWRGDQHYVYAIDRECGAG
jgi:RimJ/RimL family protein N-acetyltransferase